MWTTAWWRDIGFGRFFTLWASQKAEANGRHLKLKKPAQLQEVLDISRTLLSEVEAGNADLEIEEKRGKLEQLKSVLEMYDSINPICVMFDPNHSSIDIWLPCSLTKFAYIEIEWLLLITALRLFDWRIVTDQIQGGLAVVTFSVDIFAGTATSQGSIGKCSWSISRAVDLRPAAVKTVSHRVGLHHDILYKNRRSFTPLVGFVVFSFLKRFPKSHHCCSSWNGEASWLRPDVFKQKS